MISTHFPLSFLIKIGMFFPDSVAVDLGGGVLSLLADPGQSPGGGRGDEAP